MTWRTAFAAAIMGTLGTSVAACSSEEVSDSELSENDDSSGVDESAVDGTDDDPSDEGSGDDDPSDDPAGLHGAFSEFDPENVTIYMEGDEVVIETNGLPNHTSPYWGEDHELYVEPRDGWAEGATPSRIPGFDGSATLRVSAHPEFADQPSETTLGTIGIAVSGAAIFNDQEGNGPLSAGVAAGLDYSGGHIGPSVYHYHTEPAAISIDDDNLVGIMADGFFMYGRKCESTGTYPEDLDEAGGHSHDTEHSDADEYHYHIINETILNEYYLIFAGEFQGTPGQLSQ